MSIIKKHYEKIILSLLLVIFLLSLLYLIGIINSTSEVTDRDLAIPKMTSEYVNVDFSTDDFDLDKLVADKVVWKPTKKDGIPDNLCSDLLYPIMTALCPHCHSFIPMIFFGNDPHACVVCQGELPTPGRDFAEVISAGSRGPDSDGDGIPDSLELLLGLNPNDPMDGDADYDNDGFPNMYEAIMKTDINNPKSHPPFYKLLFISEMKRLPLGVTLNKVYAGEDGKTQLELFNGKRNQVRSVGEVMYLNRQEFTIVSAMEGTKTVIENDKPVQKDDSVALLKSNDDKYTIELRSGEPGTLPEYRTVISNSASGERVFVCNGPLEEKRGSMVITMGNNNTGISKYQVTKLDYERGRVELKDLDTGKDVFITKAWLRRRPVSSSNTTGMVRGMND